MRRIIWVAVFALVGGLVTVPLVTASSAASSTKPLSFVLHTLEQAYVDVDGDLALSMGDRDLSYGQLLQGEKVVGRFDGSNEYIEIGPNGLKFVVNVTGAAELASGQITLQGRVTIDTQQATEFDLAVTGGTGRFAGARGYAHVEPIEGSADLSVTIYLIG